MLRANELSGFVLPLVSQGGKIVILTLKEVELTRMKDNQRGVTHPKQERVRAINHSSFHLFFLNPRELWLAPIFPSAHQKEILLNYLSPALAQFL